MTMDLPDDLPDDLSELGKDIMFAIRQICLGLQPVQYPAMTSANNVTIDQETREFVCVPLHETSQITLHDPGPVHEH